MKPDNDGSPDPREPQRYASYSSGVDGERVANACRRSPRPELSRRMSSVDNLRFSIQEGLTSLLGLAGVDEARARHSARDLIQRTQRTVDAANTASTIFPEAAAAKLVARGFSAAHHLSHQTPAALKQQVEETAERTGLFRSALEWMRKPRSIVDRQM